MGPAKMAEPIEVAFGMWTLVGTRNHILDGGTDPARLRGSLGIRHVLSLM